MLKSPHPHTLLHGKMTWSKFQDESLNNIIFKENQIIIIKWIVFNGMFSVH